MGQYTKFINLFRFVDTDNVSILPMYYQDVRNK